jgi:aryl-alcohol dehydrogenase-like predicted oxidoreductase
MDQGHISRRRFVKDGTIAAAAVAGTVGASKGHADTAKEQDATADTSKILNYNSEMEYRRHGSTGWMVSAVCLGGHARSSQKERNDIVSRCIDVGINYIDACCRHEVIRDAEALRGRRDKMYLALSYCGKEVRDEEYRTAKKLLGSLDELLRDSKQDYTDLWRITCYEPGGRHSFNTSQEIIEALETAKKQGKARAIGFSSHDRRWIEFMIHYFPQIDAVCFPFTTMTKRAPKDSLFPTLKKCDVGAFGIKPFAAGSLFTGEEQEDSRRARLAIRYILNSQTVIPIPGMHSVAHVDNMALAVKERRELDIQEVSDLSRASEQTIARLPAHYQWLKNWQYV